MTRAFAVFALALTATIPCRAQPARIPGTSIENTPTHRAILDVCDKYRQAFVRRDADTVLRVVSRAYRDDAGTAAPQDDVDRAYLEARLHELLSQIEDVTYDARWVSLRQSNGRATVVVRYVGSFVIGGRRIARDDEHTLELVREGNAWRIVSGL